MVSFPYPSLLSSYALFTKTNNKDRIMKIQKILIMAIVCFIPFFCFADKTDAKSFELWGKQIRGVPPSTSQKYQGNTITLKKTATITNVEGDALEYTIWRVEPGSTDVPGVQGDGPGNPGSGTPSTTLLPDTNLYPGTSATTDLVCDISEPAKIAFIDAGNSIYFFGSAQSSTGIPLSFNWKFGEYGAEPSTSSKQNPAPVKFKWGGNYKVTLTVTDSAGNRCQSSRHILVYDRNDPREFCEGYAAISIAQNEENIRNNCGYSGGHWHSDEYDHQKWCQSVTLNQARAGLSDRDDKLKRCANKPAITQPPSPKITDGKPTTTSSGFDTQTGTDTGGNLTPTSAGTGSTGLTLDFETGRTNGWIKTGNAFDHQPTYGDNPTARHRGQPSKHVGDYWIGTYEKYQGHRSETPGTVQGDGPTGTLTSNVFTIPSGSLSFLVGRGSSSQTRVELLISGNRVLSASGRNTETMHLVKWDLNPWSGQQGQIQLVDNASGGWGHINTDDFKFSHTTPPQTGKKNTFSCINKDNEEKGCCCFLGAHTYRFAPQHVVSVLVRFDTGKRINCRSAVTLEVDRGNGWETVKIVQANSSRNGSELAPTEVLVPVNGTIEGFRVSDSCVCCIDSSEITLNPDSPGGSANKPAITQPPAPITTDGRLTTTSSGFDTPTGTGTGSTSTPSTWDQPKYSDNITGVPCGSDRAFIYSLFQCILERDPEKIELDEHMRDLRHGLSRKEIVIRFFKSREYLNNNKSASESYKDAYQAVLGRNPNFDEMRTFPRTWPFIMAKKLFDTQEYRNLCLPDAGGIKIISATYGGNCGASWGNVTSHIAQQCNGKSRCRYTVDHKIIGDPAPGCAKTYIVRYRCGNSPQVFEASLSAEAGWGDKAILLDCEENPGPSPNTYIRDEPSGGWPNRDNSFDRYDRPWPLDSGNDIHHDPDSNWRREPDGRAGRDDTFDKDDHPGIDDSDDDVHHDTGRVWEQPPNDEADRDNDLDQAWPPQGERR